MPLTMPDIRNSLNNNKLRLCYECTRFPCQRLKHIDKRYRTKYFMSMIENLEFIRQYGIRQFVKNEKDRWTCATCGGIMCVHHGACFTCGIKLKSQN